jgi:aldehyde dehydrogenase (NAD+)
MGRAVASRLADCRARVILELAATTPPSLDPAPNLHLTLRAVAFSAMGTAGQRCTTVRRLIVQESIYDILVPQLKNYSPHDQWRGFCNV